MSLKKSLIEIPNTVSLKSSHDKFLSAQPDGSARWDKSQVKEWEQIQIVDAGNGKYGLKSASGNKFLSAQPDGSVEWDRDVLRDWEKWEIERISITLKSSHGKYLSAQPNGSVEANRDVASEWESFIVVE
jgi:hypothetical protein